MARASSAPATKLDIRILRQDLRDEITASIKVSEKEIIRQFKFIAEQIHTDAIAANKDTIDLHRNRIERIEKRLRIPHSLSA